MRPNKSERLQALWDRDAALVGACIEFRPFKGWYASWNESRYFGDDGELLGANYLEAYRYIQIIQRPTPARVTAAVDGCAQL